MKRASPTMVKVHLLRNISGNIFIIEIKNMDDVIACRPFSKCHFISNTSIANL